MVRMSLGDPNFLANAKAVLSLKSTGAFSDEELQAMYDKQVEKDREEANQC